MSVLPRGAFDSADLVLAARWGRHHEGPSGFLYLSWYDLALSPRREYRALRRVIGWVRYCHGPMPYILAALASPYFESGAVKTFQSTISSKGQVTVPADIRRHLGLSAGDWIWFIVTDEGAVEVRAERLTLEDVIGSIEALPGESDDLDREIREATEEKMARKMRRWNRQ